jgi:hypothetical protein
MDIKVVTNEALDILKNIPYKPFMCLPMSALLYAMLKDKHSLNPQLVTGDLSFGDNFIFKQDFSLKTGDHSTFKLWAGHAWVELDGYVFDLSFFRSLYSSEFIKPYKNDLINILGTGRGLMVCAGREIAEVRLKYHPVDILEDDMATGILQGMLNLL